MDEDKLQRLIEEAGIQQSDGESDEEVSNNIVISSYLDDLPNIRMCYEKYNATAKVTELDADGEGFALPADDDFLGFNGLESSMTVGLHDQNTVSGTSAEDIIF